MIVTRAHRLFVVWLLCLGLCLWIVLSTPFVADMSAFLPRKPSAQQQLLVDQLKEGIASRILIVGLSQSSQDTQLTKVQAQEALAFVSKKLANSLRHDERFAMVANGESDSNNRDQQLLFNYRYHLSSRVTAEAFSEAGLNVSFKDGLAELAMGGGLLSKDLFFKDPTGETLALIEQVVPVQQPNTQYGVWFSKKNQRAMLVLQTKAEGSDLDGQLAAITALDNAFSTLNTHQRFQMVRSGAPVYAVQSRAAIEFEAKLFSSIGTGLIVLLLLLVYRSPRLLLLGTIPVLSGAVVGLSAVALGFSSIHGITVGFGVTLIGEAVDYAIYFFIQQGNHPSAEYRRQHFQTLFWPTIRLGVLTSICGFCALLFSGFTGLAQLGLFSIAGLITAALMTRFVLPYWVPETLNVNVPFKLRVWVLLLARHLQKSRKVLLLLTLACLGILAINPSTLWQNELSALSPISPQAQQLDASLRGDVSAPEMGYLLLTKAVNEQAALERAERVTLVLKDLVDQKIIASFESPSLYLPSVNTQEKRLAALPDATNLNDLTRRAAINLPIKAGALQPFLDEVALARQRPVLTGRDMQGTAIGSALSNLLISQNGHYVAYFPLRAVKNQSLNLSQVETALKAAGLNDVDALDIKAQADGLYARYLNEAMLLSVLGLIAIAGLLRYTLQSWARVGSVLLPQLIAVIWVMALLSLMGIAMTLLHLVGFLLVVAVGSNYGLFFDQATHNEVDASVLVSLVLANTTTVIGFGILALSSLPVLQAFGLTVGPGAFFALLLSAGLALPVKVNLDLKPTTKHL
jgi:predicted exporter